MDPIIVFGQSQVIPLLFVTLMRNGGEPLVAAKFGPGARFSKVPVTFRARKAVLCLSGLHSRSKL